MNLLFAGFVFVFITGVYLGLIAAMGALIAFLVNLSGLWAGHHVEWWQAAIIVLIVRLLFGPSFVQVKNGN